MSMPNPPVVLAGIASIALATAGPADAASPGMALKEITPNCVATPLPTTPSGPSVSFEVQTAANARLRVTAWRQPCTGNDAQLVLTMQPLAGTPFVCGTEVEIVVGAFRTDDILLDVNPNDGVNTGFCAQLAQTTSFVIHEFDGQFTFDDDAAFTLVYESDVGPDGQVQVPAFDASQYAGGTLVALSGKLSGSYYEPARDREGVLVEFGQVGGTRVAFLSWYTYFQGQQRWLAGNITYQPGATEVTIPLIVTSGGQFGNAYNPAQVQVTPWGNVTISFPNCRQMRFAWSETGGQSGLFQYQRPLDSLDGISCP